MAEQCTDAGLPYNDYKCYVPYSDGVTWDTAKTNCESLGEGSSMAFIKDSLTQEYIEDNVPDVDYGYWIGGVEGRNWKWASTK